MYNTFIFIFLLKIKVEICEQGTPHCDHATKETRLFAEVLVDTEKSKLG